jgi:hypothetical protein
MKLRLGVLSALFALVAAALSPMAAQAAEK